MLSRSILIIVAVTTFVQCKKGPKITSQPQPPPVVTVPHSLLKDVSIPNLPAPYYHFEYDATGKFVFASFASDLDRYHVLYDAGGRLTAMKNDILVNQDELKYFYDSSGRVSSINYTDSFGSVYTRIFFTYSGEKLVKLDREKKSGSSFVHDKTTTLSYYPDGNLEQINYHYFPFNGQPEASYTLRFEGYDYNVNVDGFGLLHEEFFDHFFLLPGIKLQINNPAKEIRTGDGLNYSVNYTYIYDNNTLPFAKKGDLVVTNGSQAGQHFETNSIFTYY